MKKTRVKIIALAIAAVLLLTAVLATSVFAAFFSSSVPIGSDVLLHQIDKEQLSTSFEYITSDFTFTHPGDKAEIDITLSNSSLGYYHYFYGISLMEANGLENAVLVYFDGEFLGTLAQLEQLAMQSGKNEYIVDRDFYILDGNASTPREENHVITFELHMAAEGSRFEDKTCKVNIVSYAQTYDVSKIMFVNTAEDLYNALYDVSLDGENTNKTIILTADIDLSDLAVGLDLEDAEYLVNLQNLQTQALKVSNPCTIDLRGYNIAFNGFIVNLLHEGTLTIKSSKTLEGGVSGEGGFLLNNPLGIVDFADSASFYALNHFDIALDESEVLQYDKAKAVELMEERFLSRLSNLKLHNTQSFYPFGALYCYALKGGVSVTPSAQYDFDAETGLLTPPQDLEISLNTFIELDGEEIIFKFAIKYENGDESVLQDLIDGYLQHIPSGDGGTLPSITYDLFLPLRFDALNATISWKSSNSNLMTGEGKIGEKAEGDVILTAVIKINENLYYRFFNFYVVRQDNEMKFNYLLALLSPITLREVYPAQGSLVVLPVVNENDPDRHYTYLTGGKDLGLTELSYEIDPSYYYLGLGDIDGDGYANEVFISEPTFQVYAQVIVKGRFANDGVLYEGNIGVRIELGDNTQLIDNVFRHVASYLSSVDVLQNIIDTRVLFGMQGEKGDFLLPSSYNGFDIKYEISPFSQGIVSSISDLDENGKYSIGINASNFNATDTAVPLTVTVFKSSLDDVEESRELFFNVPSVIKKNSLGFADEEVYNAVKLQVWQQLPQNEQRGLNLIDGQLDISSITNWNYILMRDVKLVSSLIFQNGSPEQQFTALLGWATSTSNREQEVQDVMSYFVGHIYAHNESDGMGYISPAEFDAIEAFLGGYEGFSAAWTAATTKAYDLTDDAKTVLLNSSLANGGIDAFLASFTNLTRVSGSTTDTFTEHMDWARGTSYHTTLFGLTKNYTTMANYGATLANSSATTEERINPSVTPSNATALVAAYMSAGMGFNELFQTAWNTARDSLGLPSDADFYVLLNAATNVSTESQMNTNRSSGSSNYRKGYIYTGATTSSYTQGHLYILCRYIANGTLGSGSTTYGYYDAGLAADAKYTYDAAFEAEIVAAMKTLILNGYNSLLEWATGEELKTAGIAYLSSAVQGNTSDGKATVSAEERAVIVDFWTKVLPTSNSAFATLWNNAVPQVDIFTDTGISELNDFYREAQGPTENLILLDEEGKIPRGMEAIIANADKTQIGSLYKWEGAEGEYINGSYYRLSFNADDSYYYFEEIDIDSYTSAQDLLDLLANADQNAVGITYLFNGEDQGGFIEGLAYLLSYDGRSGEYYFKPLRIKEVDTLDSYDRLYYPYVSLLDASTNGLSYFINLKELYVLGAPSDLTPIFTAPANAKNFFSRVTTFNANLEKLAMRFASLGDISSIGALKNLKYLDLSGNGNLYRIGALTNLDLKNLGYLDLHNTGISYGSNLAILANIYYGYKSSSHDGAYPDIYYTDNGVRTRFELVPDLNEEQIMILNYLFYLKEIGSSNSKYTLLPSKIYVSSSQSYDVTWYEVIGDTEISITDAVTSGGLTYAYRYLNQFSGTETSSFTILRARITLPDGTTYYRDFEVILVG